MKSYHAIGIMSGTSLDGLDIVFCRFNTNTWSFKILKCQTIDYSEVWQDKLSSAPTLHGYELTLLDKEFGRYIGHCVEDFLDGIDEQIDLIASHGHTVFHQPNKGLTLQIGDGQEIAIITGIKTICDFRSLDVSLGGEGAPLVPIGDQLLFSEYDYCINIGGFANLSFKKNQERIAYDICPANIMLNAMANKMGHSFDRNGALGLLGSANSKLLEELNNIEYYKKTYPKSLGKEWLDTVFLPILNKYELSVYDQLKTIYEHIATQISKTIATQKETKTLVTGGGAYNKLLIHLIKHKTQSEIIIPEKEIIEYKEAIIFALLGVLRQKNEVNCLASVTGATRDSSTGVVFNP